MENSKQAEGLVYLVGAGPGDPGLITARGLACLRRAEVVIYDYLANPLFLDEAPPEAERIYVGKTCGCHHTPQEHINGLLLEHARAGRLVVRLKGGDPFIFGRGGEEASLLYEAGIPFEVVPGVTAGFAAAAYAGIPLTHRDFTTSLGLFTGHEKPEKKLSSLDWEKIATGLGTLVFYMGMTNLPVICEKMVTHGRSPETPVAVIRWATTPRQQVVEGTLATIVDEVARVGLKPPAVIVVGEVVGLRRQLRWFEDRPLLGKRILVTRSASTGSAFAQLLEQRGAEAVLCPVIRFAEPEDSAPLDAALKSLGDYDDLVLTSANAVERFFARLDDLGLDARALGGLRLIAVGPKTAASLRQFHLKADILPDDSRAEGVAAELTARGVEGRRILYPRAQLARTVIPDRLGAAGARVDAPVLYRTLPEPEGAARLAQALKQGLDAVTFTASSTVRNLLELADADQRRQLESLPLFSIGPETSRTMSRLNLPVAGQAERSTLEGLTDLVTDYFTARA